jgi:translation initiation factor IF-2
VEAVRDSVLKMSSPKVEIKILHTGSGAITENDVLLAEASKAVIIGFGVRPESKANKLIEEKSIKSYCHRIIYELLSELDRILKGMFAPEKKEKVLGRAEVKQALIISKVGTIAGFV